jgi:hypothetical protein
VEDWKIRGPNLGKERPDGYPPGRFAGGEICERCRIVLREELAHVRTNHGCRRSQIKWVSVLGDEFSFRFGPVTTALLADRIDEGCLTNSQ